MNVWTVMPSPVDDLRIVATDDALVAIEFAPHRDDAVAGQRSDDHPFLQEVVGQLNAYFDGERTDFDLPLAPQGTPFQQEVWAALRTIPYGGTASYGEIAVQLGRAAGASRAVGLANGRNPVPIVVPCHRVIGASGKLVGYAGGMERKQVLLALEGGTLV